MRISKATMNGTVPFTPLSYLNVHPASRPALMPADKSLAHSASPDHNTLIDIRIYARLSYLLHFLK
jgi:hypothetical protein